jgi:hypothetical protein
MPAPDGGAAYPGAGVRKPPQKASFSVALPSVCFATGIGHQNAWLCFKPWPKPRGSVHHAVRAKALVALCILARTTAEALAEFV